MLIRKSAAIMVLFCVVALVACESKVNTPVVAEGAQAQAPADNVKPDETKTPTTDAAPAQGAATAPTMADPNDPYAAPADVAKPPEDAQKTESGVWRKSLKAGTGTEKPTETDKVEVHYTGWTVDGKMFDSSHKRNQTAKFPLTGVIPGWREAVKTMVVGEKARFWIPEEMAYKGMMGAPQGMLVFDIELINATPTPKIETPADVAAPPKNATKHPSGIFSRVIKAGTGKEKPTETQVVSVHYSGWTVDGKMFDSSVQRGEPTSFPLNRVIPGWREAVKTMVVGEKSIFWIPEELAYKGTPGAPQGMLVFEIELLEIVATPQGHGPDDGHGH